MWKSRFGFFFFCPGFEEGIRLNIDVCCALRRFRFLDGVLFKNYFLVLLENRTGNSAIFGLQLWASGCSLFRCVI